VLGGTVGGNDPLGTRRARPRPLPASGVVLAEATRVETLTERLGTGIALLPLAAVERRRAEADADDGASASAAGVERLVPTEPAELAEATDTLSRDGVGDGARELLYIDVLPAADGVLGDRCAPVAAALGRYTRLARWPNWSDCRDSVECRPSGETHNSSSILASPPRHRQGRAVAMHKVLASIMQIYVCFARARSHRCCPGAGALAWSCGKGRAIVAPCKEMCEHMT